MPYIPVALALGQAKSLQELYGKNVAWWQKDAVFNHKFILYSAYPNSKWDDTREKEGVPDDCCVLCDSGGYQVYSLGVKLDRERVFEWQRLNGDLNFVLDCPPRVDWKKRTVVIDDFKKEMNITYENTKWYAEQCDMHRRNNTLGRARYILICQTFSLDHLATDIERFASLVDSFDAIAVAYHGSDNLGFFSAAMKWREILNGRKKDLHLLGVSGNKALPAISYLQTIWNGRVTFDSSSVFAGGKYRTFWLNTTINETIRLRSAGAHKKIHALPCSCPFCTMITTEDGVDLDAPGVGTMLALHNLFVIIQRVKVWDWMVREDVEQYKKMAKDAGAWESIEFMDRCLQYGWERTMKSYWWSSGARTFVTEKRRTDKELAIDLACFGNYDVSVCKDKCDLAEQCSKMSGV